MKKTLKVTGIVVGSILLLILIVNIGFTLWLKYQLPDYIKNKTPYAITYKTLNVEILSGSISADDILIKSKNPNDKKVLAIDGFVDGLNVSRLGIIDLIKNKKINTNSIRLTNPRLKIRLAQKKTKDSVKEPMPFFIRNIDITKGNIDVINPDDLKAFSAKNLNLEIKNLSLNDNPNELPFALDSYKITAKDFFAKISDVYTINSSDVKTNNGQLEINDFELKSILDFKDWEKSFTKQKSLFSIKSKKISFNDLVFDKAKLNLKNAQFINPEFVIQNRDAKIIKPKNTKKNGIDLNFANIDIKNGTLSMLKSNGEKSLSLAKFDANVKEFLMDDETSKNKLPFKFKDYKIVGNTFFYDSGKYYNLSLSSFNMSSQSIDLMNFKMIPKMSRAEFVRTIPMEDDQFNISANRIQLSGVDWTFEKELDLHLKSAKLHNVDANIFRSKIPKDNPKEKLLYSKVLRNIKFPLVVDNLSLINSKLVYEEDKPDNNGPGKVFFTNFNLNVKNLNSNKKKGTNTKVPIVINCNFMGVSPMKVNWNFDTSDLRDNFTIGGYINDLPANDINPFIKPYMNITATGTITSLDYNFKGNNDIMNGKFKITHKDLKVALIDKDTKEKKKFLSGVANLFVKKDSQKFPESVDIYVERNKERSFFNFYWKGIEDGLKKTLLIIKI
ncbi:AsmA family protein [Epilithonimonas lactis]|uniref:DUF748 domain-containing protein n=1 Tax=Epilithonimonas lactis TaxID=421072 RepID=A0A085BM63_9FLAO|nr:hypothetical protein [Epilithonimonas lactis]KFC23558.1 hypothetical protein IO89_02970 [Epilithonimonas lactis]SEQ17473.1 hypothetical protein SAMN04488097_1558 [Epilithonimonas lactis]